MRAVPLVAWLATMVACTPCLRFEPATVTLTGRLVTRTYPGPPEYESVAAGDSPERPYIVVLDAPICVAADPHSDINTETVRAVGEVQLAFHDAPVPRFVGRQVQVSGTLFTAHTIHHWTPVLLWTTDVR